MVFVKTRTADERFDEKVDRSGDCWIWLATKMPKGYGTFWYEGHNVRVHRFAWEREHGPIPAGFHIHHICANESCVNPAHMELKRPDEHWLIDREMAGSPTAINARKTHCKRGHPLTEGNVITWVGYPRGRRSVMRKCRTCERERQKRLDAKRKAERHAKKAASNSEAGNTNTTPEPAE